MERFKYLLREEADVVGLAMQSMLLRFREDSLFRRHRMEYTMRLSLLMAEFFLSSLIKSQPEFGVRNPMHQRVVRRYQQQSVKDFTN